MRPPLSAPKAITYQNFDLIITPAGADGHYTIRVIGSPVGEQPPATFTLPFNSEELRPFFALRGRTRGVRLVSAPVSQVENLDPQRRCAS
jgi:hypothetical protein